MKRKPANIFYVDDRDTFERIEFPQWGSLHRAKKREKPWGTAFLISNCHIGSAYHVVKETHEMMTGDEIAYFDTPLREEMVQATPVKWGKAWLTSEKDLNSEDWVILKLKDCFSGEEVKPLTLKSYSREDLLNLPLFLAGFPEDRHPKNITVDSSCFSGPEILTKDTGIGHDCATRPGNSGSPLIQTNSFNQNEVVAIVVASRGHFQEIITSYSNWISNKACPVGPMAEALIEIQNKKAPREEGLR